MPYGEMNGDRFFYAGDPAGKGIPLVLCHGSGGSHRHWLSQLRDLSAAVNPLAVDLPGHGRSAGEPEESIAAYRAWLHDFCATLGLKRFILGGHSMGGAIVLDYALHHPGDLAGLVLVGTGARLRVAPAILEPCRAGQVPAAMLDFAYSPQAAPGLLEEGRKEMETTPAAVYLADLTACDRFDVMDRLEEIELPVLIICGGADRLTPVKYSRYLQEHLRKAELVEIEGAGHMVMLEAPAEVNRAIERFATKLPSS